jgi:hypothetical protein
MARTQSNSQLQHVADFIRRLHEQLAPEPGGPQLGVWMSRPGEGSLFLDKQESADYRDTVTRLQKQFAPRDDLSCIRLAASSKMRFSSRWILGGHPKPATDGHVKTGPHN